MIVSVAALLSLAVLANAAQDVPAEPASSPSLQLAPTTQARSHNEVESAATEYVAYHGVVSDLHDAPIGSGDDLDQAMDRLSAFYGDDRLVRAWIAYTAMIAARHPEYLDDVREVADYYGIEAAMSGLMYDPAFATSLVHAPEAQSSVVDAIETDSAEIRAVSERFRSAAYELQSARWANRRAGDRQDRLRALTDAEDAEITVSSDIQLSMATGRRNGMPASSLFERQNTTTANPASTPQLSLTVGQSASRPDRTRIGRILSVAALQNLSDDPVLAQTALETLLSDPAVERCMAWVRLDLQQCVAAGHFKYEDSFCIAEHALLDVSRCLGAVTNQGQ